MNEFYNVLSSIVMSKEFREQLKAASNRKEYLVKRGFNLNPEQFYALETMDLNSLDTTMVRDLDRQFLDKMGVDNPW